MKNKKPGFYYIFGSILTAISLTIMVIFLFLPAALQDGPEYMNYISLGMVVLGLVIFFFGYFLLKKANYINKQKSQEDVKRKFENEFNKVLHQDELDAIRSRELEASLKNKDKE